MRSTRASSCIVQSDRHTKSDRHTDIGLQTDRHRPTDRQTDRQTDRHATNASLLSGIYLAERQTVKQAKHTDG